MQQWLFAAKLEVGDDGMRVAEDRAATALNCLGEFAQFVKTTKRFTSTTPRTETAHTLYTPTQTAAKQQQPWQPQPSKSQK